MVAFFNIFLNFLQFLFPLGNFYMTTLDPLYTTLLQYNVLWCIVILLQSYYTYRGSVKVQCTSLLYRAITQSYAYGLILIFFILLRHIYYFQDVYTKSIHIRVYKKHTKSIQHNVNDFHFKANSIHLCCHFVTGMKSATSICLLAMDPNIHWENLSICLPLTSDIRKKI